MAYIRFMKKILLLVLVLSAFPVFCAEQIVGTVKANMLNVRVKPGEKYAVIAQLSRNDKIDVIGFEKGWYEIVAPQKASAWISSSFVRDGVVTKKTYVRTGPSVACPPYAKSAEQGVKVEVLDKSQEGWLRIAVFEGLTAWVNADFVEVDPVQAGSLKNEKQDAPAPGAGDGKEGKGEGAGKDSATGLKFSGVEPNAVSYEGILVPVMKEDGTGIVTHALASKTDGNLFPICYVFSRKMNMKLWEGKKIQVTGLERWVMGWHKPVVEADIVNALW